jgi:CubicO group peptidase (beta-lactamase class C family)
MPVHDEITQLLDGGVRDRVFPGAVWGIGDAGGLTETGVCGLADPENPDSAMRPDTIFDVASLTKVLAVWASIGSLWEAQRLRLDDTMSVLLPELAEYPLGPVTVRHLLTHTAGVPLRANLRALYGTDPRAIKDGVLQEDLHRQPGQAVEYTDRAALILGFLAERLTGTSLDQLAETRIWHPLGMRHTRFGPSRKPLGAHPPSTTRTPAPISGVSPMTTPRACSAMSAASRAYSPHSVILRASNNICSRPAPPERPGSVQRGSPSPCKSTPAS